MRWELKYLVPQPHLDAFRAALAPFTALDHHGQGYEAHGYTVRSIYFDTPTLRYYHEKMAGIKVRRKLRIRAYNQYDDGDWVFLEIKRKVDQTVSKNRAPTLAAALPALFRTGDVARHVVHHPHYPHAETDARRFFYHLYRYNLRPTALTVYEREAFVGRYDPTLRITLDRNLRGRGYPSPGRLYEEAGLQAVHPGFFILEVKFNTHLPGWLRRLLGTYALRQQAISKYCLCLGLDGLPAAPPRQVIAHSVPTHRLS